MKMKGRKISPWTAHPLAGMNLKCWASQEKAETVRFLRSRFYHSTLLLRVHNGDFPSEFSTLWVYNFFRSPGSVGERRSRMKNWWNNSIIERRSFVCEALRIAGRAGRAACAHLGGNEFSLTIENPDITDWLFQRWEMKFVCLHFLRSSVWYEFYFCEAKYL